MRKPWRRPIQRMKLWAAVSAIRIHMRGRTRVAKTWMVCPRCKFATRFLPQLKAHYKQEHIR